MTVLEKFSMKGKVALVTGGAGLLGREFCRALAEAGGTVYLADRDQALIERSLDNLRDFSHLIHGVRVDVTDPVSVRQVVEGIVGEANSLDVLVNSAALDPKFDPQHPRLYNNAFEEYPWLPGRKACRSISPAVSSLLRRPQGRWSNKIPAPLSICVPRMGWSVLTSASMKRPENPARINQLFIRSPKRGSSDSPDIWRLITRTQASGSTPSVLAAWKTITKSIL